MSNRKVLPLSRAFWKYEVVDLEFYRTMLFTIIIGIAVVVILAVSMTDIREMFRVVLFGSRNDAPRSAAGFDPAKDIPSLAGKVIMITGAAGFLGRQTAIELARYGRPARIYVADLPRDEEAKKAVANEIIHGAYGDHEEAAQPRTEIRFVDLDLASLESVRDCAANFIAQEGQLDILFLNAGIIRVSPATTMEGYEAHFGINYLGHALLARLLTPLLRHTADRPGADVRVVVVSSEGHLMAPKNGVDFDSVKSDCAGMVGFSHIIHIRRNKSLTVNPYIALRKTVRTEQSSPDWLDERALS